MDYFSSEDAPLLNEFHRDFEVAIFPETPLLPACEDDDFSDFVQSPTSEVPPESKSKATAKDISTVPFSELPMLDYIQEVAVVLIVQFIIPIPFMLPMGIAFTKRALKLFFVGFAVGLAGHASIQFMHAIPSARPFDSSSLLHLSHSLPDSKFFVPAFFTQLKICALGGFAVGAGMSHVLNLVILGHTICRLCRGLEPEPTAMRRSMDSSKTFRCGQRIILDLLTGMCMMPMGLLLRNWYYGLWAAKPADLAIDAWHSALVGVVGTAVMQFLLFGRYLQRLRQEQKTKAMKRDRVYMTEVRKELISF
ncbi:hypothetical protein EW026_g1037 [Hermanssonia centrifuga]|uniref:Uncharacterized protein n=1 Tax=Hermanssonia centrifuga TaxID=98765 RepID=A0A4S4KSX5_9APHY|nr:hypothetical protein EW026_g1037 [Hermanssonia centrifuga]